MIWLVGVSISGKTKTPCVLKIFSDKISYVNTAYDVLENADCLVLMTEWDEFRRPDFDRIKETLKEAVIFDARNQYNPKSLTELGIKYIGMNFHN